MVTLEFIENYNGTDIYKSVKKKEDNSVMWVLYYADGFPHKVGSLVLNRISSTALWGVKKQINKYKKQPK